MLWIETCLTAFGIGKACNVWYIPSICTIVDDDLPIVKERYWKVFASVNNLHHRKSISRASKVEKWSQLVDEWIQHKKQGEEGDI